MEEKVEAIDDLSLDGLAEEQVGDDNQQEEQSETGLTEELFPEEAAQKKTAKAEKTVPLKALKEERSKRQQYEKQFNELMQMHKEVLGQLQTARQPNEPAVEDTIDDESFITGADLKKILTKERERLMSTTKSQTASQALVMARQRYNDFDDVVRYADELISNNPALKGLEDAILSNPNAPFLAYELGKLHPEYQRKMAQSQSLSNKIQRNLETPQPNRRTAPEVDIAERIRNLDPLSKEFADLDAAIQKRMKNRGY